MKQIIYFLFLCFALSLIACDDRIDDSRKSDFHGDTLVSIAWNYPLIMESHYGTMYTNEGNTRRVPVIPRSWSGMWSGLYVIDSEDPRRYGVKADTSLLLNVIVRGDTVDRRKKEYDEYDRISRLRTGEVQVGRTPVLCGVDRLEAVGTDAKTGEKEIMGESMRLRLRSFLYKYEDDVPKGEIQWVACEPSKVISRYNLTEVGRLDPRREARELEPRIKIYVPFRVCRKYNHMRVSLLLVNRQKLHFEIAMPDPSTLTPEGFKVYRREYMDDENVIL